MKTGRIVRPVFLQFIQADCVPTKPLLQCQASDLTAAARRLLCLAALFL